MDIEPVVDPLTIITVTAGDASPEEAAAAIAVVAGMLRDGGAVDAEPQIDRWAKSARSGRELVEHGIDSWDEFTAR